MDVQRPNFYNNDKTTKASTNPDFMYMNGTVIKVLPATSFIVELDNGAQITAYIAGRLKKHYIKILKGDRVNVMISKYDTKCGRICERYILQTTQMTVNPKNRRNERPIRRRSASRRSKNRKK